MVQSRCLLIDLGGTLGLPHPLHYQFINNVSNNETNLIEAVKVTHCGMPDPHSTKLRFQCLECQEMTSEARANFVIPSRACPRLTAPKDSRQRDYAACGMPFILSHMHLAFRHQVSRPPITIHQLRSSHHTDTLASEDIFLCFGSKLPFTFRRQSIPQATSHFSKISQSVEIGPQV